MAEATAQHTADLPINAIASKNLLPDTKSKSTVTEALSLLRASLIGEDAVPVASCPFPAWTATTRGVTIDFVPVGSQALGLAAPVDTITVLLIGTPSRATFHELAITKLRGEKVIIEESNADAIKLFTVLVNGTTRVDLRYYPNSPGDGYFTEDGQEAIETNGALTRTRRLVDVFASRYAKDCALFTKAWAVAYGLYSKDFGLFDDDSTVDLAAKVLLGRDPSDELSIETFCDDMVDYLQAEYALGRSSQSQRKLIPMKHVVEDIVSRMDSEEPSEMLDSDLSGFAEHFPANSFIRVELSHWGTSRVKAGRFFKAAHHALGNATQNLQKSLRAYGIFVRAWPVRLTHSRTEKGSSSPAQEACYFIAITKAAVQDDKTLIHKALDEKTMETCLSRLNHAITSHSHYDSTDSFAQASRIKRVNSTSLQPHQPNFGPLPAENLDEDDSDSDSSSNSPKPYLKPGPKPSQSSVPSNPLRPANDILSRLLHDPAYDPSAYVVGYIDRHAGLKEMEVEKWGATAAGDSTGADFVPQSRIRYFREKDKEGKKIWDRDERLDRVFGSGRKAA